MKTNNARINSIIFVDRNVEDYQDLITNIDDNTQVIFLDSKKDGIEAITDTLKDYQNLDSIQVLSHGNQGQISLGNSILNNNTLDSYHSALKSWGDALSETGDILFYGCNIAKGDKGKQFIKQLSLITGSDIAASTNLTGSSLLNGDWNLEYSEGTIDSNFFPFDIEAANAYSHTLSKPTTTITSIQFSDDTGSNSSDLITKTANQTISGTLSAVTISGETIKVSLNDGENWVNATNTTGSANWTLSGRTLTEVNTSLKVKVVNNEGDGTVFNTNYIFDETVPSNFTVTSGTLNQAIPDYNNGDGPALGLLLNVSPITRVVDINVKLNISHESDEHLDVFLIHPDATTVLLFDDVGSSGNNFTDTILDNQGLTSISGGRAPFSGSFQPEGDLNDFYGKTTKGGWVLKIEDDQNAITGTLNNWSLIFSSSVIDLATGSDKGSINTDNITKDNTPTFDGITEAGAGVELFNGTTSLGTTTANASDGTWSLDLSDSAIAKTLNENSNIIRTKITDIAGNVSDFLSPLEVTIDTVAPNTPTLDLSSSSDSAGHSNTDNITFDNTPTFTGTAEAGSTVKLFNGTTLLGTAVNNSGDWSFTPTSSMGDGEYSITATATDLAGNESAASSALSVTIDTDAPTLTNFTTIDTIVENTEVELTFSELNAKADESSDTSAYIVQTVSSGTLKIGGAVCHASSNNTIDATHKADWKPATNASGTLDAFTVKAMDAAGNLSDSAIDVTVHVNDTPTIGSTAASQAVNDNATITPFSGVTITDNDTNQTQTVSVTLDDTAKGSFTTLSSFTNNNNGSYSFSGTASATQTALRGLVFTPTANRVTPTNTETTTFTISVDDGVATAVTDNKTTVDSTSVNDAPTIRNTTASQEVDDNATISPFSNVTIVDVDDNSAQQTQTVSVTLDDAAKGSFTTLSGFTANNGSYSFSGTASATQTALQGLVFTPTANHVSINSTETTTFTISVYDGIATAVTDNTTTVISTSVNDAPIITGDLGATVEEARSYTLLTADLGYTDVDDADVTFTVSSLVNGKIQVSGSDATSFTGTQLVEGNVSFLHTGNDTTAASFKVVVEDGNEDSSTPTENTFNITVTPVNVAPVITSSATINVAENQTTVTTITSTDTNSDTVTYSLTGGADQSKFTIDTNSGALTFKTAPDFESPTDSGTNNVYDVEVTAKDNGVGTLTDVESIAVTVTNVNETPANVAPVITSSATVNVAENKTTVTTITSTDANSDTVTYSLTGGADQSKFAIDTNSGALTFKTAPDFETPTDSGTNNVYDVQVTATDNGAGTLTDVESITVTVTNVNETPANVAPVITSSTTVNVAENQTTVTTITSTDANSDTVTYSLTGGADQSKFAINSTTGALTFASAPDFETPTDSGKNNVYDVQVTATDNGAGTLTDVESITVTVTNVNETPANVAPVITSSTTVNVAENQTTVTTITSTDANSNTVTYSLTGGADQSKFAINSTTGALTFASAPDFETPTDSGTNNVYDVQVTATDNGAGTLTDVESITVTVTDVTETPTKPTTPLPSPVTPTLPTQSTVAPTKTTVDGIVLEQNKIKVNGENVIISKVQPIPSTRVENASTANPNHADIPLGIVNNGSGISVIVPTSIGFQAVGLESPQLQPVLKSNLITDIQSTFKTDSVNTMVGGNNFIANFSENHSFFEQKIVLTTDDTKSLDKSIIIDGTHKDNSDNSVTNTIVVDATAIDSNMVLELKQISFAAITGGVSIIADDFNNTLIIGNNQTQQSVSTKGGDDLIHISKGSNLQQLHGGLGNDVTQFEGSINDYQIHQDFGRIILTSSSGVSTVATLVGIETLKFADKTMTVEYENAFSISGVTGTYLQMFGRQPHVNGVKFWTDAIMNKGLAPGAMALAFMNSGEQLQKIGFDITQADIGTQVEQFYLSFFHRNVDEAGKDFWVNNLTSGTLTLEDLATEIILSPEMQAHYTAVSEWDFFV